LLSSWGLCPQTIALCNSILVLETPFKNPGTPLLDVRNKKKKEEKDGELWVFLKFQNHLKQFPLLIILLEQS